jgi:hypothetical protein
MPKYEGKMNLNRKSFSGANFLVVGVALFLFGLLMILEQATAIGLFKGILPDVQSIQMAGVAIQFGGEILVIFGVMKSISNKFLTHVQSERQAFLMSFSQTNDQIARRFAQTNERIDKLVSVQRASPILTPSKTISDCRFCGAKIGQGNFCPKCGKSQY